MKNETKQSFIRKTRLFNDGLQEWFIATWQKIQGGYEITLPSGETEINIPKKYKSLRSSCRRNFYKFKFRRKVLNDQIKKKKLDIFADYWWAKFWRKVDSLERLATELATEPDLPEYEMSNKNRSAQILDSIRQSRNYYRQFNVLFTHVPYDFAYQAENFKDFFEEYKKTKKEENRRKVPKELLSKYSVNYF